MPEIHFKRRHEAKRYLEMLVSGGLAPMDRSVVHPKSVWLMAEGDELCVFLGRAHRIGVRNRVRREDAALEARAAAAWPEDRLRQCFDALFVRRVLDQDARREAVS